MDDSKENMKQEKSLADPIWFTNTKNIFVGTLAGITATMIGHPFDTLKVRLQVQSSTNPVYGGVVDCFWKTIKWEGVGGLYKGVGSPLAGQIFMRTALFTSYYESLEYMKPEGGSLTQMRPHQYFVGGFVCGVCSAFVDTPLDVFKSKLQIQIMQEKLNQPIGKKYANVFDCAKHVLKDYGVRGAYQGLTSTIVRNALGYGCYFYFFERLKRILMSPHERLDNLPSYKLLLAGGLAGIIFWTLVFNVDVVKSAMMADALRHSERAYSNSFDCAYKLFKNEGGYMRFWKGFTPCLLRSAPVNATMLFVVEGVRGVLPSYAQLFS